jgi:hypothetical protein
MSLSRDGCQGWPGAFQASFLPPLCFLVYVSLYSLGPYLRIDCYFRLRFLTLDIRVKTSQIARIDVYRRVYPKRLNLLIASVLMMTADVSS